MSTRTNSRLYASSLDVGLSNLPNDDTLVATTVDSPSSHRADALPENMLTLPRHSHEGVNEILEETEHLIQSMHQHSKHIDASSKSRSSSKQTSERKRSDGHDSIFANTYVDLGEVTTVGFDYDYTLVTYTEELLELIYDMALKRLVHDRHYPLEMLDAGLAFDPFFSIRGT